MSEEAAVVPFIMANPMPFIQVITHQKQKGSATDTYFNMV